MGPVYSTNGPNRSAKKRVFTGSSRHSAAWHRFLNHQTQTRRKKEGIIGSSRASAAWHQPLQPPDQNAEEKRGGPGDSSPGGSSRHSAAWYQPLQPPDRNAETKRLRRINRRSAFFIGAEGGIANPAPPAGPGERGSGAGAAEVECRGHSRPPPPRGPQREP